jgi:tRNA A37 methylthiotransferase MiaB
MLDAVPDGAMLRVGMTNPPYILQHLAALLPLLRHPRCYAFMHVPVQSGSNAVLSTMRREYTVEQCALPRPLLIRAWRPREHLRFWGRSCRIIA